MNSCTLLTGCTGVVGQLVLTNLLRSQLPVAVLVRSNARMSARDRVEQLVAQLEQRFGRSFLRPTVLQGNLSEQHLGLTDQQRRWLTDNCTRVLHSAANLSFVPAAENTDNEPFRTNVDGTRNLLHLCAQANIREFHYVSTAYVCGLQSGTVRETALSQNADFANDYERSKVQAEQLLASCSNIDTLTVYRPSIVVDPGSQTATKTDQAISTAFSTYQLLSSRFGLPAPGAWLKNLGLNGDERKNIVPADWVARMIVQILRRSPLHGETYHLTSAGGTTVRSLEDGFRKAVSDNGSARKLSSLKRVAPAKTNGLLNKLAAPYVATFLPYFRDDPKFDQSNLTHALEVCGEQPCPAIDADDIASLAKAQLKDASITATANPDSEVSVWSALRTRLEETASTMAPAAGERTGLLLTGLEGGEWTVSCNGDRLILVSGLVSETSRNLYTSAGTLSELIQQTLSVDAAFEAGRILVEYESDHQNDGSDWLEDLLLQLQAALRGESELWEAFGEVAHAK